MKKKTGKRTYRVFKVIIFALRAKMTTRVCESWRVGVDMGRSGDRFLYLEVCRVGLGHQVAYHEHVVWAETRKCSAFAGW